MEKVTQLYKDGELATFNKALQTITDILKTNFETDKIAYDFLINAIKRIEVMLLWVTLLSIVEFLAAIIWIVGK